MINYEVMIRDVGHRWDAAGLPRAVPVPDAVSVGNVAGTAPGLLMLIGDRDGFPTAALSAVMASAGGAVVTVGPTGLRPADWAGRVGGYGVGAVVTYYPTLHAPAGSRRTPKPAVTWVIDPAGIRLLPGLLATARTVFISGDPAPAAGIIKRLTGWDPAEVRPGLTRFSGERDGHQVELRGDDGTGPAGGRDAPPDPQEPEPGRV